MWPFKKKQSSPGQVPVRALSFSQLDTTEHFGDNLRLTENDWIQTTPLNELTPDPQAHGLPPRGASDETVYAVAARLSRLREIFATTTDGVYCPICHIANISLPKVHTPCPKCNKPLLRFDWT